MRLALSLIGQALVFSRKHPLLHTLALWLLVIPGMAMSVLLRLLTAHRDVLFPPAIRESGIGSIGIEVLLQILVIVVGGILIFWGIGCVLCLAKLAVQARLQKKDPSFQKVLDQGKSILLPLLLTELLQECIIILWGFLFIIPGIVVLIRTALVPVIVAFENIAFRPALRRSRELVLGHTLNVGWTLLWLWLLLFLPVFLVSEAIANVAESTSPQFLFAIDLLENGLMAVSMVFQNLCLVFLYIHQKDLKN